jgi:hypothetical protein
MTENWRPVVGYEGRYEVSDQGRVKSLARLVIKSDGRHQPRTERILKQARTRGGHMAVCLSNNGQRVRLVHHLVLEAFVGPRPLGMECCHSNDTGHDNRLENLRWDTRHNNLLDQVRNGRHHSARKTHCKSGHKFSPENTRIRRCGARTCRQCEIDRHARKKAA